MEQWYEYWFANVEGITGKRKKILRENVNDAEALYNIEETMKKSQIGAVITEKEKEQIKESRGKKSWKEEYKRLELEKIRFVPFYSPLYPGRMKELPGMPYALYGIGELPEDNEMTAAVVGARRCSAYGERMTLKFSEILAAAGVQIISGMAKGIDGAAHRGALNVEGRTYAVLGCGVNICYPGDHKGLYEDLRKSGGIWSEYPPGTPPLPAHFPARNRIISALADTVLVMEAREKSGSLITADMALEQGRDVYALPGMVESELSRGCNRLIRQGAGILLSPEDLLAELGIFEKSGKMKREKKSNKNKIMLESAENLVYSKFDLYPRNREEILKMTGLSPQELAEILISLELKGYIVERPRNYYIRRE